MYKKIINNVPRVQHNPFVQTGIDSTYNSPDSVIEAVVVDVIVNDSHPQYAMDGYNVGAIKFRDLRTHLYRDEGDLNWAFPLDANISEYPLREEIVHIVSSLNRYYYTRKVNASSKVTAQSFIGIEDDLGPRPVPSERLQTVQGSIANPLKSTPTTSTIGDYFQDLPINRLRHDEGDIIFEGRSGQSIRFGASWKSGKTNFQSSTTDQQPNIILRIGQGDVDKSTDSAFAIVTEDINLDKSSLYMVSDQILHLEYSTQDSSIHAASIPDLPNLTGNQIAINSDRIIFNSKVDKIMGFSKNGIHWTSGQNFSVDSEQDYLSVIGNNRFVQVKNNDTTIIGNDKTLNINGNATTTINKVLTLNVLGDATLAFSGALTLSITNDLGISTDAGIKITSNKSQSFVGSQVFIGTDNSTAEPIPAGASLAQFLMEFLDAHIANASSYVITPVGPGALSPAIITQLIQLKADVAKGALSSFNSTIAFLKK